MRPPARTDPPSATLVSRRATFLTLVVVRPMLLPGSPSVPSPVAPAALRALPARLGFMTTVIVTLPPAFTVPNWQLIGIVLLHEPCVVLTDTTDAGTLNVSVTLVFGAPSGPLLVTVIVYVVD